MYKTMFLFIVLLCTACAAEHQNFARKNDEIRYINVCVLNDAQAPVEKNILTDSLRAVAREFRDYAGIQFVFESIIPYQGDLTAWDSDQGMYLAQACLPTAEIKIVFSNQDIFEGDTAITSDDNQNRELGGSSNSVWGYVLVYSSEHRYKMRSSSDEPALMTVLRHDLAHLFHIDHSDNTNSFMFPIRSQSFGQWTGDTMDSILKHKNTRWHRMK